MPELLKNQFNPTSLREIAHSVQTVYPSFAVDAFLQDIFDDNWDTLELKARWRHISTTLGKHLPAYPQALSILERALAGNPVAFFFPDFIEVYGQDDWELSIAALANNTHHWSGEFAVRAFILKDEARMMQQMYAWSKSDDEHIRRLSSEGCRPQLPWAQSLPMYKKDPTPILPIIKQLKADPSLYVRKSVANNLNDISKTHPDLVLSLAQEWLCENKNTDWVIKHACRTLLKRGNRQALALFGFDSISQLTVTDFIIAQPSITMGDAISFSFCITAAQTANVRLEYGIDFVKANGTQRRKIFQIASGTLQKGQSKCYTQRYLFEDLSTRKHYPGVHAITLILNGHPMITQSFEVR